MQLFILIILIILIFEIIIFISINHFKKKFQWIITDKDEYPNFPKKKLLKFYTNSFNPIMGWDRKKGTSGKENANKITKFSIDKKGFRSNKKLKKTFASVYGDLFAFCRYVNDNKTWKVSLKIK